MKTPFLGAIILAFVSLSSCDKVKDAIQADINYTAAKTTFTIGKINQTDVGVERVFAGSGDLSPLDLSQYSGIKSIRLKSIKVKLTNADDNSNFKSLKKIQLKIKSSGKNDVVLAEYTNSSDNRLDEISIPVTSGDVDLKSFLTSKFSYELKGEAKSTTAKDLTAEVIAEYTLKFGL